MRSSAAIAASMHAKTRLPYLQPYMSSRIYLTGSDMQIMHALCIYKSKRQSCRMWVLRVASGEHMAPSRPLQNIILSRRLPSIVKHTM
jgi:hypothetical protein